MAVEKLGPTGAQTFGLLRVDDVESEHGVEEFVEPARRGEVNEGPTP